MKKWINRIALAVGVLMLVLMLLLLPFSRRLFHYKSVRTAIEAGQVETAVKRVKALPASFDLSWTLWRDISWVPEIYWIYKHIIGCPSCAGDGYPLLWHAARNGETEVVAALLNKGAALNYEGDSGSEYLRAATMSHNTNAMRLLLQAGANIGDTNYLQVAPIHMAVIDCN